MADLTLRGISKRFGNTQVLDNLSLDVAANELVVVLGPSGCGKSTLLRVIAGLESIDAGEVRIDGQRVDHLPPGKRDVAMVFQGYALYPHMTVRGNIAFGLKNIGMRRPEIDTRIDSVARMLELEQLLDRLPGELSGGQRQRVAIGRALVKNPKVFMFDEPLSNLDAALRSRTRREIANLHRRIPAAMIYVTHDQLEAMTLADRIVIINRHRIEQVGTPAEIYGAPATLFVATFLGAAGMNILRVARATSTSELQWVQLNDGTTIETLAPESSIPKQGELRIGVRPETVQLCAADCAHTSGQVESVEFLGDKTHVHLCLPGGDRLIAQTDASFPVTARDVVGIKFDGRNVHVFDAEGRNHRRSPPQRQSSIAPSAVSQLTCAAER